MSLCVAQQVSPVRLLVAEVVQTDSGIISIATINKLLADGDNARAEKLVRQHLKSYPHDADYLIVLSRILYEAGKVEDSINTLESARNYAKSYEDIYLLEAAFLSGLNSVQACEYRTSLINDYYQNTSAAQAELFKKRTATMRQGRNELQIDTAQDELSNNRGIWRSAGIWHKWSSCSGQNTRVGYNTVERYQHNDEEVIIGGGLKYNVFSIDLE
ncbi:MAG: tetratricopeptide repeat protein, partial [Candidatus Heimdallarchaeota archaeon]|nr:tetratricopeptide repeat protein [Candidatus Heimdallarchaeota archaeon]